MRSDAGTAKVVMLRHPGTGIVKKSLYGFGWTTLLSDGLPALFPGDYAIGLICLVAGLPTCSLSSVIMAFIYDKHYTQKLLEAGYQGDDCAAETQEVRARLGIAPT